MHGRLRKKDWSQNLFMFWAFIAHMLVFYHKPWLGVIS